jgi:hypothetical protein
MIDRRAMVLRRLRAAGRRLCLAAAAVWAASSTRRSPHARRRRRSDRHAARRHAGCLLQDDHRHADVPAIALYALGPYQNELKRSQRDSFFRGVACSLRAISPIRPALSGGQAEISPSVRMDADEVLVHSTVTLTPARAIGGVAAGRAAATRSATCRCSDFRSDTSSARCSSPLSPGRAAGSRHCTSP